LLGEKFFPLLIVANLSNINLFLENEQYLKLLKCLEIIDAEITIAIKGFKSSKALGLSDINNKVIK
jgi:hypothetical protein